MLSLLQQMWHCNLECIHCTYGLPLEDLAEQATNTMSTSQHIPRQAWTTAQALHTNPTPTNCLLCTEQQS